MKKELKRQSIKYTIFFCLFLFTCISFITLARYISGAYGNDSVRVALFGSSTSVQITDIKGKPSDVVVVPIWISNVLDGKVSEVSQIFTINISSNYGSNLPLVFNLYKDKECTELVYRDENNNYFDDEFKFIGNKKEEKEYFLRIEWPSDSKDVSYAFEIDYLSVNFRVVQVD